MLESVEAHMGTLVRIRLYDANAAQAPVAFRRAFARIAELDEILSDYKPDSELNRVCREAVGRPARVSADLYRVLEAAQLLAERSGGAFDVTLGPVTRLWRGGRVPDGETLRSALRRTGFRKVHLEAGTVMLDEAGMQLDLGGIAKGFAADEALTVLRGLGLQRALVAVSGDIAIGDAPPGAVGWKVHVGDAMRELKNCAVSTSGDAEQHSDKGGARHSHIVDPASGMGLVRSITVTVIAGRGLDADGLSTAISVMGVERGRALLGMYDGAEMVVHSR